MASSDLDRRREALRSLLRDHWEYVMRTQPEFASILGDKRYNDRLADLSPAALLADREAMVAFLARAQRIDITGFGEQELLDHELFVLMAENAIEDFDARDWEMPVNQISGIQVWAPHFPALLTFTSVKDYDDYASRLAQLPKQFDDTIETMRLGRRDGLMPPRFLLEKVAQQSEAIAAEDPAETPFAGPLSRFPDSISEDERRRIRDRFLGEIREHVLPAYCNFAKFVRDEYAPHGRTAAGIWAVPNGDALYARYVRRRTTTNLTADEIHEIGLREVARIEGDMLAIAKSLGAADLRSFNESLDRNPAVHAKSREHILQIYRSCIEQMYRKLPQLFGRLPRAKVIVVATDGFREKEAPGAEYISPAPDGSRPGRVEVNTRAAETRKTISMESTAYHEAVPGHHLQLSIAQELPGIADFRKQILDFTAYIEGWALYSERLGKEVGFFDDPYNDYGRLEEEMLRAVRLVVDTGMHAKRWTREQVVQFFHERSATDEVEVQAETDRYMVWPAQALGYKVGQLKILELREQAKRALGADFDIRTFHDEVLGAGALPLDVLETRIENWLRSAVTLTQHSAL